MRVLSRALLAIVIPIAVVGAVLTVLRTLTAPPPLEPVERSAANVTAATTSRAITPSLTSTPPTLVLWATPTPPPTAMPSATATPKPTAIPTIESTETPEPTLTALPTLTDTPATLTAHFTPTETPAIYGEVASFRLNLRSGPGAGYELKLVLIQGDRLEVIAKATDGTWVQVIAPDGTEGWVNSSYTAVPQAAIEGLPVAEPSPSE